MRASADHPVLFVEGLKLRPSALRVLLTLPPPADHRHTIQQTLAIERIAAWSGLSPHVVRARLHELRGKGLVRSVRASLEPFTDRRVYGHHQTAEGARRARTGA